MISVVVPIYSKAHYIKKRLDNIYSQIYPNLEIICINDTSNDGSGRL